MHVLEIVKIKRNVYNFNCCYHCKGDIQVAIINDTVLSYLIPGFSLLPILNLCRKVLKLVHISGQMPTHLGIHVVFQIKNVWYVFHEDHSFSISISNLHTRSLWIPAIELTGLPCIYGI